MKGKTVLKKKEFNQQEDPATNEKPTESKMIKGKTKLGKKLDQQNENVIEKNNSQHLLEQIIITYFTSAWQNKVIAMKSRVSERPNEKARDLRAINRTVENIIKYHKYLYLMKLFDNMSNLPMPTGVEHDPNYGKIFLVKGEEKPKKEEIEVDERINLSDHDNLKEKEEETKIEIKKEKQALSKRDIRKEKVEEPKKDIRREKVEEPKREIRKEKKKGFLSLQDNDEEFKELDKYYYRSDGRPLDRVDIEKDINRLIDEYPDKDIDVDRILHSKRLQYKLKHPRFSPLTGKENLDSFVRYLYTYKPGKSGKKGEHLIVIKNKTYAYY